MRVGIRDVLVLIAFCLTAFQSQAATVTVDTYADEWRDEATCSLRQAIRAINWGRDYRGCQAAGSYGTDDTIVLDSGTYALTRNGSGEGKGDLDINASVVIYGTGGNAAGTVIDASATNDRVFEILGGTVTLSQLLITGGTTSADFSGGGVQNSGGNLTINYSTISGNTGIGRAAGGVGNDAALTIIASTIADNSNADATVGAGVDNNDGSGTAILVSTTISDNNGNGPGVYSFRGTTELTNVTLAGNAGAALAVQNGSDITIRNSIVTDGCVFSRGGTLSDGDFNIDAGNSCGFSAANSLSGTNPMIGVLADNGGATHTRTIDNNSPAFDRIPTGSNQCLGAITTDQRNAPRAGGSPDTGYAACDVGAFEYVPSYTLAVIAGIRGYTDSAGQTVIEWHTIAELGSAGFDLQRRDRATRSWVRVNQQLVPGLLDAPQGGEYQVVDDTAVAGESYRYRLVETEISGRQRRYGPWWVTIDAAAGSSDWLQSKQQRRAHRRPHIVKQPAVAAGTSASSTSSRRAKRRALAAGIMSGSRTVGRILVREDGLYQLKLVEMSILLGESPAAISYRLQLGELRLTNRGKPVAWHASADNGALQFYGQAPRSSYTRDNVYWLSRARGERMVAVPDSGAVAVSGASFAAIRTFEQDRLAATAITTDPDSDYWYWDYLVAGDAGMGHKSYDIELPGVAPGSRASITVYLRGANDPGEGDDHRVEVILNGALLGSGQWNGTDRYAIELPLDPAMLIAGTNTVELTASVVPEVSGSIFFFDAIEVAFPSPYRAEGDVLDLYADDHATVTVDGFSAADIRVVDISEPMHPQWLEDVIVEPGVGVELGNGFQVSFRIREPGRRYLALSGTAIKRPFAMRPDRRAGLRDRGNGADYLVIAPASLKQGARALARYRRGSGLRTRVVVLEEIYDEFNHGLASPHALRRFLAYAFRKWSSRPRFVVLVGKGTLDYRDLKGEGDNLMPPMLVGTELGLFSSDNRFADVNRDGMPEMAVGRIPARSNREVVAYVAKLTRYESVAADKNVLLLSDDTDIAGNFLAASRTLARTLTGRFKTGEISLANAPLEVARERLFQSLETGVGMVNYQGHGGVSQLAVEGLLTSADLASLNNSARTPILTALTCVVNRFELPGFDSLGEELVMAPNTGMIAVWSASGVSVNADALVLNREFYRAHRRTLGATIRKALREYRKQVSTPRVTNTYNLIGDPAIRM